MKMMLLGAEYNKSRPCKIDLIGTIGKQKGFSENEM